MFYGPTSVPTIAVSFVSSTAWAWPSPGGFGRLPRPLRNHSVAEVYLSSGGDHWLDSERELQRDLQQEMEGLQQSLQQGLHQDLHQDLQ